MPEWLSPSNVINKPATFRNFIFPIYSIRGVYIGRDQMCRKKVYWKNTPGKSLHWNLFKANVVKRVEKNSSTI